MLPVVLVSQLEIHTIDSTDWKQNVMGMPVSHCCMPTTRFVCRVGTRSGSVGESLPNNPTTVRLTPSFCHY